MDSAKIGADLAITVKRVIAGQCREGTDPRDIPDEEPLAAWGIDSMRSIDLLLELESAFGITFPDDLITTENFSTAGSIVRTVAMVAVHSEARDA